MQIKLLATIMAAALAIPAGAGAQTVIVYSRHDTAAADRAYALAKAFTPVWIDRDLQPGQLWQDEITRRICNADAVLVIWSAAAAGSREVARELGIARACQRRTIPLILDSTPLPDGLAGTQRIDWRVR